MYIACAKNNLENGKKFADYSKYGNNSTQHIK